MGEFNGYPAAIHAFQQIQDVPELHPFVPGAGKPASEELVVQVGFFDTEKVQLQDGRRGTLPQAQRIQIRYLVPAQTVHLYKP